QELVRQGMARAHGSWTTPAGQSPLAPPRTAQLRPLDAMGMALDEAAIAVGESGVAAEAVRRAGLFRAVDERVARRGLVAVNADSDAGRTDLQPSSAVQAWLAGLGVAAGNVTWLERGLGDADAEGAAAQVAALRDDERGSPISLPLFIAALIVALCETVMARFFSHAFKEREVGRALAPEGAA
ncbi:MAG: hypothetical protein VYC34_12230, partial [Planctomycetota bacterium]|nr:hypothetical protein [Planctomycetota bacterium]